MNLPKLTYPFDLNEESILILQPPVLFGITVDYSFEFPQGHISSTLGFLLDGGLLKQNNLYTTVSLLPLASQTSIWLSSQTAEEAGGRLCV